MTQPQDKMCAEFEAWCAKDNPRYRHTDDGITSRRDWKVWQAACAQQSAQSQQDAMTPLTDEQIKSASLKAGMQEHYIGFHSGFIKFARAIEAGHGITAIATQGASNV